MIFEIIASDFSIKSETPIRRTFFPLKRSSPSILISFDKLKDDDSLSLIHENFHDIIKLYKENGSSLLLKLNKEFYDINDESIVVETDLTKVEKELIKMFYGENRILENKFHKNILMRSIAKYLKEN